MKKLTPEIMLAIKENDPIVTLKLLKVHYTQEELNQFIPQPSHLPFFIFVVNNMVNLLKDKSPFLQRMIISQWNDAIPMKEDLIDFKKEVERVSLERTLWDNVNELATPHGPYLITVSPSMFFTIDKIPCPSFYPKLDSLINEIKALCKSDQGRESRKKAIDKLQDMAAHAYGTAGRTLDDEFENMQLQFNYFKAVDERLSKIAELPLLTKNVDPRETRVKQIKQLVDSCYEESVSKGFARALAVARSFPYDAFIRLDNYTHSIRFRLNTNPMPKRKDRLSNMLDQLMLIYNTDDKKLAGEVKAFEVNNKDYLELDKMVEEILSSKSENEPYLWKNNVTTLLQKLDDLFSKEGTASLKHAQKNVLALRLMKNKVNALIIAIDKLEEHAKKQRYGIPHFAIGTPARTVVHQLVTSMRASLSDYLSNFDYSEETTMKFIEMQRQRVKESSKILSVHRGWKGLLGNVLLALSGIGLLFIAAKAIDSVRKTGTMKLFFQTRSAEHLEAIEKKVDALDELRGWLAPVR